MDELKSLQDINESDLDALGKHCKHKMSLMCIMYSCVNYF